MTFDLATAPRGVDISRYQLRPSMQQLVDDGISFLYIKAWQGDAPDPDFLANVAAAERAGLLWWWYPFLAKNDTVKTITDAMRFVAAPKAPAIFDWETAGVPASDVALWKNEILSQPGAVKPWLYRGIYPVEPLIPEIEDLPWVLAEYTSGEPRAPAWDGVSTPDWTKEWVIWQNSGSGRLGGISTTIDLDVSAVTIDLLKNMHDGTWSVGASPSPTPASTIVLPAKLTDLQTLVGTDPDGAPGPETQAKIADYVLARTIR